MWTHRWGLASPGTMCATRRQLGLRAPCFSFASSCTARGSKNGSSRELSSTPGRPPSGCCRLSKSCRYQTRATRGRCTAQVSTGGPGPARAGTIEAPLRLHRLIQRHRALIASAAVGARTCTISRSSATRCRKRSSGNTIRGGMRDFFDCRPSGGWASVAADRSCAADPGTPGIKGGWQGGAAHLWIPKRRPQRRGHRRGLPDRVVRRCFPHDAGFHRVRRPPEP